MESKNLFKRKYSFKVVMAVALTTIITTAFLTNLVISQGGSAYPDIYLDVLPASSSFLIGTDGTYSWAIYATGQAISDALSTDALTTFQAVETLANENCTINVKHGDYTFSAKWDSAKSLRLIGEGLGTRLIPAGAFDAIDPANLTLWNIIWQDSYSIDHDYCFESSIIDYMFDYSGKFLYCNFESLDGFTNSAEGTGSNEAKVGWLHVLTGNVAGNTNYVAKNIHGEGHFNQYSYDKDSRFKTCCWWGSVASNTPTAYIGTGTLSDEWGMAYGFKLDGDDLYGIAQNLDGTPTLTDILETVVSEMGNGYVLEARFFVGNKIDFYINGALKGTLTTGLPYGSDIAFTWLSIELTTNIDVATEMQVGEWMFQQYP